MAPASTRLDREGERPYLYRFLAALIYNAYQCPSKSIKEAWSQDPFEYIPYLHEIISRDTFQYVKTVLHCQTDGAEEGKFDSAGLPMLKKIGFLFEAFRERCRTLFSPGEWISFDEMMVLCTCPCPFFNFMPAKPSVRKGLKFLAACFSRFGMQYTFDCQLSRKSYPDTKKPGNSVNCQLLRNACAALNIHGVRNHKHVTDRGFTSVKVIEEVLRMGHQICGTFTIPKSLTHLKDKSTELVKAKTKGAWSFCCHKLVQLAAYVWVDSSDKKTCNFLSMFHAPAASLVAGFTILRKQKNP